MKSRIEGDYEMKLPILAIVVPCYNEESVLPSMAPVFREKLRQLVEAHKVAEESYVLFVNDGSRDKTWDIIAGLHDMDAAYRGVSLSRNRGHQNALLCGLMESMDKADVVISSDCDGQDDVNAIDAMVDEYQKGAEIVYACRNSRVTDTWFKRITAESFYRLVNWMGGGGRVQSCRLSTYFC